MFGKTKIMLEIIQKQAVTIDHLTAQFEILNDIRHDSNKRIKELEDQIEKSNN